MELEEEEEEEEEEDRPPRKLQTVRWGRAEEPTDDGSVSDEGTPCWMN